MAAIDLNADLGETVGGAPIADDAAMFAVVSSASIACGGHAGDAVSMRDSVQQARRHGVAIGAHPSYPDLAGFGRTRMRLDAAELRVSVRDQIRALVTSGAELRYVKPHGALYNTIVGDAAHAHAVADAIADVSAELGHALGVLGLGGEIRAAAGQRGLPFWTEAFGDRGYRADGTLVPRSEPGALVTAAREVADRAVMLARDGIVRAVDGSSVDVDAASICVHGDTPGAVGIARTVRAALEKAGVKVSAPW